MIESFNHYTVNTGHSRQSFPSEVNKELYFIYQSIIKKAREEAFVDVIDGIKMKLTVEKDKTYVCSLYTEYNGSLQPILITCGCCAKESSVDLLKTVRRSYKTVSGKDFNITPMAPFVLDMILPAAILRHDALEWTGDFTRCIGWEIMSPESVRK